MILFDDAELYCITSGPLARRVILSEVGVSYRDSKLDEADIATAIAGLVFMQAPDTQRTFYLIGSVSLFITPVDAIMISPMDGLMLSISERWDQYQAQSTSYAFVQNSWAQYRSLMDTLTRGMYGIEFEHPPQPPPLSRERLELELKNTRIFRRKIIATLSLLNAKNVIQEPVNPPHANRAARRRKDPPPFAYHVLKVRPFAAKIRRQGGSLSDHNVLPQAIHWVRGHFKRYTPERPLLGRHTGVFWFQPHLAGKNPRRVVAKDYEIKN